MNPPAINRTIRQIWANASPTTQPYYDLGRADTTMSDNWAVRWLLYKRFRYTDKRNNHTRQGIAGVRSWMLSR